MGQNFFGDTRSGIGDRHSDRRRGALYGNRYFSARRRVLQGVANKVFEDALDQADVGVHGHGSIRLVHLQGDLVFSRLEFKLLHDVLYQLRQRKLLEFRRDAAGVEHGQLKQILDQPVQVQRMLAGNFQVLRARGGIERVVFDDQRLDVTLHGSQWRAQVVRDVGDQLAPQPVVLVQRGKLLLNRYCHVVAGIAQLIDFVARIIHRRDGTPRIETSLSESRHLVGKPAQPLRQVREQ